MKKLTSKWDKTASGYDSYEIADGESKLVFQLAPLIQQQFGLTPHVPCQEVGIVNHS